MSDYKETISFIDKTGSKVTADIEIENDRFTMSGEYQNSCGQVFDHVKPATQAQAQLIKLWEKYHLNTFHKETLPKDFETKLTAIVDELRTEEKARLEAELTPEEQEELKEKLEDDRILALKEVLELQNRDTLDVEDQDGENYDVQGITYTVLTESEAERRCRDYLESNDYIWKEAVANDRTTKSFDDWIEEVIQMDGYGHILNSYDGSEDGTTINGVYYYVIRIG